MKGTAIVKTAPPDASGLRRDGEGFDVTTLDIAVAQAPGGAAP